MTLLVDGMGFDTSLMVDSSMDKCIAAHLLLEGLLESLALDRFFDSLHLVHSTDPSVHDPTLLPDLTLNRELQLSSLVDKSIPR